jgi:hypothetical protein
MRDMRRWVILGFGCAVLALGLPNLIVWLGGRSPVTSDVARVPHAQAALVLEASTAAPHEGHSPIPRRTL